MIVFSLVNLILTRWFYLGWSRATARECRSLDSVILDVDISEEIIEDAREFLGCGDWYRNLGIPYRRTYLFHGTYSLSPPLRCFTCAF